MEKLKFRKITEHDIQPGDLVSVTQSFLFVYFVIGIEPNRGRFTVFCMHTGGIIDSSLRRCGNLYLIARPKCN